MPAPSIALLLALLLGLLMPLSFAPFGQAWLALLCPAGLMYLWRNARPAQAAWRGLLFGVGMFGGGVYWVYYSIHVFGHAALAVALLVMALLVVFLASFTALLAFLVTRWRAAGQLQWSLAVAAGWVALEWLRGWLFTGFSWLDLGYGQIDMPLAAYAPLIGVYGVSLAVMLSAAALYLALAGRGRLRGQALILASLVWGGALLLQTVTWTSPGGEPLKVSLIQGNIPQDLKWQADQQQATLETYTRLTFAQQGQDLVIWPETAIPLFYHQVEASFIPELEAALQEWDLELLTGIPLLERDSWAYYNTVISLGGVHGVYKKQHLVPFGEYLPLRRLLGTLLAFLTLPQQGDFSTGGPDQPLLQVAGYPVGTSICYEVAFGEELIRSLPDAALLVNVSNDAWFGDTLAPHQHLEMARMRALETGRYLLRATNTGISAIIGPKGELLAQSPQFEEAVVRGEAVPRVGATAYVRFGNGLVLALLGGIVLIIVFVSRR